jgi:hypothetical protein
METTTNENVNNEYIELHKRFMDSMHSMHLAVYSYGIDCRPYREPQKVANELMNSIATHNNERLKTLNEQNEVLKESMNVLTTENAVLKKENEDLKNRMDQMENRMNALMEFIMLMKTD